MGTYSRLFAMVICLSLIAPSNAFGQAGIDDSQMRESAAARIMKAHDIEIDWRNTSLLEITNIEMRLNTVDRIKREHGISFDWRKKSLLELTDAEARLNTVKRIKRDHGVAFDWQKTSLLQLTDTEARMNMAKRIESKLGKSVDWKEHSLEDLLHMEAGLNQANTNPGTVTLSFEILFPPTNQQAMGLHKLTEAEKEELRKHVETLLFAAAQVGAQQQLEPRRNTLQARGSITVPKLYTAVGGGHWVQKNVDSGTYMVLEDGSLWEIDPFDKIDAMLWLPISNITVIESSSGSPGYDYLLINTDDGEKAHAKYMGKQ